MYVGTAAVAGVVGQAQLVALSNRVALFDADAFHVAVDGIAPDMLELDVVAEPFFLVADGIDLAIERCQQIGAVRCAEIDAVVTTQRHAIIGELLVEPLAVCHQLRDAPGPIEGLAQVNDVFELHGHHEAFALGADFGHPAAHGLSIHGSGHLPPRQLVGGLWSGGDGHHSARRQLADHIAGRFVAETGRAADVDGVVERVENHVTDGERLGRHRGRGLRRRRGRGQQVRLAGAIAFGCPAVQRSPLVIDITYLPPRQAVGIGRAAQHHQFRTVGRLNHHIRLFLVDISGRAAQIEESCSIEMLVFLELARRRGLWHWVRLRIWLWFRNRRARCQQRDACAAGFGRPTVEAVAGRADKSDAPPGQPVFARWAVEDRQR